MKISYFDSEAVWRALREFVHAAADAHPEVERVLVFGSLARGEAVPGSDVDLLFILSRSGEPFLARMPRYIPSRFPVGVEVFPYTEDELAGMLAQGNAFLRRALAEGVELYRRQQTPVGS